MICPYCNSDNIEKTGMKVVDSFQVEYVCNDCNKLFFGVDFEL